MVDKKAATGTNFWDILKWIVICGFLILIILIIIANTVVPRASTSSVSPTDPCKLTCSGKDLITASNYLIEQSSGTYIFSPNYGVVVDENTCDINYGYKAMPSANHTAPDIGSDYRRFKFSSGCNKQIQSVGPWKSGETASSPTPPSQK